MNRHKPSGGGVKAWSPYAHSSKKPTSAKPKIVCDVGFYFWAQQIHETVAYFVDPRLLTDSITFMRFKQFQARVCATAAS